MGCANSVKVEGSEQSMELTKNRSSSTQDEISSFIKSEIYSNISSRLSNPNFTINEKISVLQKNNIFIKSHSEKITSISAVSDSDCLLSSSLDKTVKIWNTRRRKQIGSINFPNTVEEIVIAPNKKFFLVLIETKKVHHYNFPALTLFQTFENFECPIKTVSITPDSLYMLTGGGFKEGGSICLIYKTSLSSPSKISTFSGHTASINNLICTADKKFLISCSGGSYIATQDNSLRLWNLNSQKLIAFYNSFLSFVTCAAYSKDLIFAGTQERSIYVLTYSMVQKKILRSHNASITDLKVHPTKQLLISSAQDSSVNIWDFSTENFWCIKSFQVNSAGFLGIYENNIFVNSSSVIKCLSFNESEEINLPGHSGEVDYLALQEGSHLLVSAASLGSGRDGKIRIWNLVSGEQVGSLLHPGKFTCLNLTKDGLGVMFKLEDGTIKAFSLRNKKKKVKHTRAFDFLLYYRRKIRIR